MRANNARDTLAFLAEVHPSLHRELRAKLPAEVLDRIDNDARTAWIPVELDGHLVDGILDLLGPDGAKSFYRDFLAKSLIQSPMMRVFFEGALRAFGVTPGGLLKVLPGAFKQSYQDSFDLTVTHDRSARQAHVVLDDIAPELLRFKGYVAVWEGVFLGLYDLAHTPPQLEFRVVRELRRVEATFRW